MKINMFHKNQKAAASAAQESKTHPVHSVREPGKVRCYVCINGIMMPVL